LLRQRLILKRGNLLDFDIENIFDDSLYVTDLNDAVIEILAEDNQHISNMIYGYEYVLGINCNDYDDMEDQQRVIDALRALDNPTAKEFVDVFNDEVKKQLEKE
jgi:hypothetical protein